MTTDFGCPVLNGDVMDDQGYTRPSRLSELRGDPVGRFHPGQSVCVRSATEILATLDMEGRIGNVPFLPDMLSFIGCSAVVLRRDGARLTVSLDLPATDIPMVWKEEWMTGDAPLTPMPVVELAARQRLIMLAAYNASLILAAQNVRRWPAAFDMGRWLSVLPLRRATK